MQASTTHDLIIFDLDETLLDLNMQVSFLREKVVDLLNEHKVDHDLYPLYQGVNNACVHLAKINPGLALKLSEKIWSMIRDHEVYCAKERATIKPGMKKLLNDLKHNHLAIYSNNHPDAIKLAIGQTGLDESMFVKIIGRSKYESLKPSGQPIVDIIKHVGHQNIDRIYFCGDSLYDSQSVINASDLFHEKKIYFVAFHKDVKKLYDLENKGAHFLARDEFELQSILNTRRSNVSLSACFLAYNEQDTLPKLINDIQYFSDLYVKDFEAIIVDDGSTDQTPNLLSKINDDRIKWIKHEVNGGMGQSMQSSYLASTKQFCVPLPADRQVRLQNILVFLKHIDEKNIVFSTYETAHSGFVRLLMSIAFRFWTKRIGGLKKDFAGAYVFERKLLNRIDSMWKKFSTFVLSFVLLQEFSKLGLTFVHVSFKPFPRQFGSSKEANQKKIKIVLGEIFKYRRLKLGF